MFDKVTIKATIDTADIDTVVLRNYLEQCTEGDEIYYKSTAYANFDGCFIEIHGSSLRCKCSIHKLYTKSKTGRLDNSRPLTFAIAVRTIKELLLRLCVRPENAVVVYYEVGLTMKLSRPADEYIRMMRDASGRLLWNDANYSEYRQVTTEKSKYFRKIFKAYDKTFEAAEKGHNIGNNILRIETIYRHQSVPMSEFISSLFLSKTGRIFYRDWSEIRFIRGLSAVKGVKISQLDKAREINWIGISRYKEKYKKMYLDGMLTKKQWETIRNFARSWPDEKFKYVEDISPLETEYKDKLLSYFQIGNTTPFNITL